MKLTRLLLLVSCVVVEGCSAINVTRVVAPTHLMVGGSGELECQISLGEDTLYSIKWYQGNNEIYRFTPFKARTQQVFRNDFLTVDVEKSTGGRVHISNVTVGADGPFRCEVSAEAPTFYTDYGVTDLRVVAIPESGPEISGVQEIYRVGDWVSLTCTASRTRPSPQLSFLLNNREPRPGWLEPPYRTEGADGLFTTVLRLRFYLQEFLIRDSPNGAVRVRCRAVMPDLYEGASDELLHTRPHHARASGHEGRLAAAAPLLSSDSPSSMALTVSFISVIVQQYQQR